MLISSVNAPKISKIYILFTKYPLDKRKAVCYTNNRTFVLLLPRNLVNEDLYERKYQMPNLLCRFEALRSDKTLLEAQKVQLDAIISDYGKDDERVCGIQTSIKMLEDRLCLALKELDIMVEGAKNAKDACRLSDERLFLTYRYLHDLTMEQTAEAMHVSRDTVYRIRRRIIERSNTPNKSANAQ